MSERGSFVTEYIYCTKCFDIARKALCLGEKYLHGIEIPIWTTGEGFIPIVAGKCGGLGSGDELIMFEFEIIPEMEKSMCHEMRIAVLAESGERIFTLKPKKD